MDITYSISDLLSVGLGTISVFVIFVIKRFIASVDTLRLAITSLQSELSKNTIHIQMAFQVLEKLENRIEHIENHHNQG